MLIFVSDLHLADTVERSTFDTWSFLQQLIRIMERALDTGVEKVTLVLLGDIFEILKSKKWIERQVRPWETVTQDHIDTVALIFDAIVASNPQFFAGLSKLAADYSFFRIEYVPGTTIAP